MNERLKEKIDKWTISIPFSIRNTRKTAEHFYNLALEDVRKAIETKKDNLGTSDIDIEMHGLLQEIIDTIDSLTE